jgi:hypothetical protein
VEAIIATLHQESRIEDPSGTIQRVKKPEYTAVMTTVV